MVADKISIEGAEKVERPDDPVVSLLITLLLLLKYQPMNNNLLTSKMYIFFTYECTNYYVITYIVY